MDRIFRQVRGTACDIIARKGYTSSAIGLVIAYLVRVILEDRKSVLRASLSGMRIGS